MASVNRVTLLGRVGKDPDVRFASDGKAIANLSLATNEVWKDKKTGQKNEKVQWHKVVLFGGLAEVVQKYVTKGDLIYVEGKIETRKWQGQDGQDKYTTEIIVGMGGTMQMLGSPKGNQGGQSGNQGWGGQSRPQGGQSQHEPPPFDDDQDIPF